jgi:dTDP-4-amino-4,6-dideoxygalactose transaminase
MSTRVRFLDLQAQTAQLRPALDQVWDDVLADGRFVGGPLVERFEEQWATYCGTAHALGVANGTDALVLALRGLGIGAGDEVLVPTNTFVATAEAVVLAGAVPRFVDVDPGTLLLTPALLAAAVTPRTAAVMVVHLYGQMPDMDGLLEVASAAGLVVIEDAAQAHGATWRGRPAGSFGAAACFSFYPGKNLGAFGDGGAVVTSDDVLAGRIRRLRDHGRVVGSHYQHSDIGTNSRLDALQAGVLLTKLTCLDAWNARRREVMAAYRVGLAGSAAQLVAEHPDARGVHHLAVVRTADRDGLRAELGARGVESSIHYPVPCHLLAPYRVYADGPLPVAEVAATEILSLPMYPHLTDAEVQHVCTAVQELAGLTDARHG